VLPGQIKDMAYRTLLSKLELSGLYHLAQAPLSLGAVARSLSPMFYIILLLLPVLFSVLKPVDVKVGYKAAVFFSLFQGLLSRYHYLSFQLARSERT